MAINYQADGEASDWMLHEHSIIAFSPEVGIDDRDSRHFYTRQDLISKIISGFYPTVNFFIKIHALKLK